MDIDNKEQKLLWGIRLLSGIDEHSHWVPYSFKNIVDFFTFPPTDCKPRIRNVKPDTLAEICLLTVDSIIQNKKIKFRLDKKGYKEAYLCDEPLSDFTTEQIVKRALEVPTDAEKSNAILIGIEMIDQPKIMEDYLLNTTRIEYLGLSYQTYCPSIPLIKLCETLGEAWAKCLKVKKVWHNEPHKIDGGFVTLELTSENR